MSKTNEDEGRREAFVLLRGTAGEEFEGVLRAIELGGGRVLHAVPPVSVMAFLTNAAIGELRTHPAVALVEAGPIGEDRRGAATPEAAEAIQVWNEHLRRRERTRGVRVGAQSWDAPGYLPPDPPERVLERLRRRERELSSTHRGTPDDGKES